MLEYIEILKGLLTPMIGVIAVYIGYQQHKTNRLREQRESRKAKLDVYKKVKRFLHDIDYSGTIPNDSFEEFLDAIAEADFLFPEEIIDWLNDVHSVAAEWKSQTEGMLIQMKESGLTKSEFEKWITTSSSWQKEQQYMDSYIYDLQMAHYKLKEVFSKYLKLK